MSVESLNNLTPVLLSAEPPKFALHTIKTLELLAEGVISTVIGVQSTKVVLVVVKVVVVAVLTTCKSFPLPTKDASTLLRVPASLTNYSSVAAGATANSVSPEIISCANFALVTVPSLGVPISKTLPNSITKSILSLEVKALAKLKVDPDTVYEVVGL